VFPRDIVCLRNISINTLHKGDDGDDYDDDDDDDDDDNNNSNNNNNNNLLSRWYMNSNVAQRSCKLSPQKHVRNQLNPVDISSSMLLN